MAKKIEKAMEGDKVRVSAFIVQVLSTCCISYMTSLSGFVYAWPSYTLANFQSNETVLSWPMSSTEVSILGSLTNIGALLITPFCGYAIDTFGRKYSAMMFAIPYLVTWTVISCTTYVPLVIAALGFAGFGAGGQAIASIYIAEIAQDSIRGGLTSICITGYFFGLLCSYILGGQLTYYQVIYTHLTLSVLYIVMLAFLKESPVFLVQKRQEEEAAKSIAFYRRCDATSKEVEVEINKIKLQLDPQIEKILLRDNETEITEDLLMEKRPVSSEEQPVSSWQFLRRSESSKRALTTAIIIMAASSLMGAIVLQVYAEMLFKEAVPSMSSNLCSILLAIDLLVGNLICAVTVDKFGRKFLMTVTSVGTGILTFFLASQLHLRFAPHWFTAVLIYTYVFVYNLGVSTIPFVLTAEFFLPEVRGLCNSIVMSCMWTSNFVTLIVFNPLVDSFGLGPVFYIFSAVCVLTAVYSHFCLPETKGLPVDAIQLLFLKKNKRQCIASFKE